jgi:hypothetical protein
MSEIAVAKPKTVPIPPKIAKYPLLYGEILSQLFWIGAMGLNGSGTGNGAIVSQCRLIEVREELAGVVLIRS